MTASALKATLRDSLAALASVAGMSRPSRVLHGRLLILTFHRVLPEELRARYPYPGLAVTPEELSWILDCYSEVCDPTTLSDALQQLNDGCSVGPKVAVTFDDAQWDNFHYAAPVLSRHRMRATFYVPVEAVQTRRALWHDRSGFAWQKLEHRRNLLRQFPAALAGAPNAGEFAESLKRLDPAERERWVARLENAAPQAAPDWSRMMTWEEILSLARSGHEIGSHSQTHSLLTQLTPGKQRFELENSKQELEARLQSRVTSFCYPNGDHDSALAALTKEVGYLSAVTTRWGLNTVGSSRYELRRCDMNTRHLMNRHRQLSQAHLDMRVAGLTPGLPK